jgi:hypothetical protein
MSATNKTQAVISESICAVIASMVTPYVAPSRSVVRTYRIVIDGCAGEWLVAIEYEKTHGDCWKPTVQYVHSVSNLERFDCVPMEKMDKTMNKYGLYWLYIESTESGHYAAEYPYIAKFILEMPQRAGQGPVLKVVEVLHLRSYEHLKLTSESVRIKETDFVAFTGEPLEPLLCE